MAVNPETCLICGSADTRVKYHGPIRIGRFGNLSESQQKVLKCETCEAGFLPHRKGEAAEYYESKEYRVEVDASSDVADYFRIHDVEQAANLSITGTGVYRNRIVADVGCGGGSFLDTVKEYAKTAIAIEPSQAFRESLAQRGYRTYAYAHDARQDFKAAVDIATSFSVIEHVEDPLAFAREIRELLAPGGKFILSTPNAEDALLEALPAEYGRFFYRKAHLWYFNSRSLGNLLERAGFANIRIIPRQRFGLSNFLTWMKDRAPSGNKRYEFISDSVDAVWKSELERTLKCDYLYAEADVLSR